MYRWYKNYSYTGKWYALYWVTSFYRTSVLDVISSYDFLCCKWRKSSGQIGDFSGDFPENPLSSLSLGSKMNWHIFWIIPQGILSHTAWRFATFSWVLSCEILDRYWIQMEKTRFKVTAKAEVCPSNADPSKILLRYLQFKKSCLINLCQDFQIILKLFHMFNEKLGCFF